MADKDLTLRLRMDKAGAEASAQQFHAAEMGRINRLRDAHGRFLKSGTEGMQAQQREVTRLGSSFDKVGASLAGLQAMMATAAAAAGGLRAVSEAMEASARATTKTGEAAIDFERKSRQLGALTGRPEAAVTDIIDFAMKTGMSLEQSDAFQQAYLGSSPSGIQKGFITESTTKEAMIQTGIMAARQGAQPKVRGELAGLMAQFKRYGPSKDAKFANESERKKAEQEGVKELVGDLEKVRMGLTEGRGEDAPLTESLIHVAGAIVDQGGGGLIADLPELAAQIGTASIGAGALGADVRTKAVARFVQGGSKEKMKFIKSLTGIDYDKDNMEVRLAKSMKALGGIAKQGKNVQSYLMSEGMDQETAQAMQEMMGVYDVYKERLAKSREAGKGDEVLAANQAFLGSKEAAAQQGETATKAAEILKGQENVDWVAVKEKARAEFTATGGEEGILSNFLSGAMGRIGGGMISGGIPEGKEQRIRNLAIHKMRMQAAAAGVLPGPFEFMTQDEEGRGLAKILRENKIEPGANMTGVQELVSIEKEKARTRGNEAPKPLPGGKPIEVGRSN